MVLNTFELILRFRHVDSSPVSGCTEGAGRAEGAADGAAAAAASCGVSGGAAGPSAETTRRCRPESEDGSSAGEKKVKQS